MITETESRANFIGGSEANMIYMNYNTKTFREWWSNKLEGVVPETPSNLHMSVGTILEHDIIDLYESINNVTGIRDDQKIKGIARANTDYILNDCIIDVKASKKASEWFSKQRIPIHYKRQLIHYAYVYGFSKGMLIAYQVDDDLLDNPFMELSRNNLYEIPVEITEQDIQTHKTKIEFLEYCKGNNIMPEG
ncbi:hypothetical protein [Virgibacillus siamensis]|uniref:hypothetical protein n=1 Tax=Virgibacillus siamensis TaxID=480071 RepID=UPI0009854C4B|nr:hypothetical protein [Virgibacillus siamensis]